MDSILFGWSAEVYKQKQFVPKQISAERSVSAIFIGYDRKCLDTCPSSLFYLPKQRKIITRRDARFNELPAHIVGTTVLMGTKTSENNPQNSFSDPKTDFSDSKNSLMNAADPPSSGRYPSSPREWEPLGSISKNNTLVSENSTSKNSTTPH